ncbi:MAG TPA: CHAT domain-containing protein [Verrucomicrobiae bacterium]|nr:CHAT domain-containing protein [Verrucomicrobiae bacterium]
MNVGGLPQASLAGETNQSARDVLFQKAEAAAQKAAMLQQHVTTKDLEEAIRLFQESARLFKATDSNDHAAEALLQVGEIYFTVSQFNKTLDSYREALVLDGKNPELRCRVLSRMARTHATMGHSSEAKSYAEQALGLSTRLSRRTQAEALEALGEALHNSGKVQESVEFFNRARDLFAEAKDANGQAQTLLMLAYARFPKDRAAGLHLAGEALRVFSSAGTRYQVAQAERAVAMFAATTDEFETIQCNCQDALPVFRGIGDKDSEAVTLNILGLVNWKMGDVDKSLRFYQSARASFASLGDLTGGAEAVTGMAKALRAKHQYQNLLFLYEEKLRLAKKAEHPGLVASAYADMAAIYMHDRQYAKAEEFFHLSLEGYRTLHNRYGEGDVLMGLARLQVMQEKYQEAVSSLESARKLKESEKGTGQVEAVARIQYELAYIYRRLNRLDDSLAAIEETIDTIEKQRLTISSFDSRASYFASLHQYYALYIQVLMLLHQQNQNGGFASRAFDAAEKSKVRSLRDLLTASSQNAPCEELLKRQLEDPDSPEASARRLSTRQAAGNDSTVTLKQVQAQLGNDGTILLEYALGDEKSYLWVVDKEKIVAHELPGVAHIREIALAFRERIAPLLRADEHVKEFLKRKHDAEREYPFSARQLSRLLLGPTDLTHAKRLLIVPDGPLQYIPFAALPLPSTREMNAVLISHHEVVLVPSASALSTLREKKRVPPTLVAAIFADPVFGWHDERAKTIVTLGKKNVQNGAPTLRPVAGGTPESEDFGRLPGSADEANAIVGFIGRKNVLFKLGFDATRALILRNGLGRYRLVHIATHGIIDTQNPERSRLILSLLDRRGQQIKGSLWLGDVYKMNLSADLVVLSACESALGKDLDSEGIIGLPRGFLYAGAKSVIASLWKVSDKETVKLMTGLYARIQRGESPSSALRGTQNEMAQKGVRPFVWGAFVLQGDYK